MMDLRVKAIREALDEAGFVYTPIKSYSASLRQDTMDHFVMQHDYADLEIEKPLDGSGKWTGNKFPKRDQRRHRRRADLIIAKPALLIWIL